MAHIITTNKEVSDFIRSIGNYVTLGEGHEYYHLPMWFRKLEDGSFECIFNHALPLLVKKYDPMFEQVAKYNALSIAAVSESLFNPLSVEKIKEVKEACYKDITEFNSINKSVETYNKMMEDL